MKHLFTALLFLTIVIVCASCEDDDTHTDPYVRGPEIYNNGVFILNQGPFGSGTGTLTFYKQGTTTQDVFQMSNGGVPLGNIVQSMIIIDTVALVSINNGASIVAASAIDLKEMYRVEDISLPRYFAEVSNDVVAVSYWGIDGTSGGVRAINIHTGETIYDIDTGSGPEKIAVIDGQLYIPLGNGFGQGSGAIIADAESGRIIEALVTADGPHTVFAGRGDTVWIVAGGWTDFQSTSTDGALIAVIDNSVVSSITLPQGLSTVAPSNDGSKMYIADFAGLLQHDLGGTYNPLTLSSQSFYGVGVDPASGDIWACDAADFSMPGSVVRLDIEGNELETLPAGVIPGEVYFYDR